MDNVLDQICYSKNFLKQVILRLDFSSILILQKELNPEFQEKIRTKYSVLENLHLNRVMAQIGQGTNFTQQVQSPFWTFSNEERSIKISVWSEFILFENSKYSTFESFKAEAINIWEAFRSVYKPISLTRMGLRYINEISLPDGDPFDWKDYINPFLTSAIDSFYTDKTELSRWMNQAILKKSEHQLIFSYGTFNNSLFPAKISQREFILDMDCSSQNVKETELESSMEEFHRDIQILFEKSILQNLKQLMGVNNGISK